MLTAISLARVAVSVPLSLQQCLVSLKSILCHLIGTVRIAGIVSSSLTVLLTAVMTCPIKTVPNVAPKCLKTGTIYLLRSFLASTATKCLILISTSAVNINQKPTNILKFSLASTMSIEPVQSPP